MSYISQEDYKNLMNNFQKGSPKGILKEMHVMNHDGPNEFQKLSADLEGSGMNEDLEKEGNAFTAGLAKAKKGQEFKIGDKAVKDTSNYDSSMEESYTDNYEGSWGYREGKMKESHPANDQWHEEFQAAISEMGLAPEVEAKVMKALDHVDPLAQYGNAPAAQAAKDFVEDLGYGDYDGIEPDTDADYEEPRDDFDMAGGDFNDGEFWENEIKKLQEIAGVKPQDDGPEDDDEDEREKRRKKAEMDDEEAENAERDEFDENAESKVNMHDPEAAAKVVAQKHGTQLKPELAVYKKSHNDYIQAIRQYDNKDPKFREITAAHNKLVKDFQNNAINLAGEEMLASGMSKVEVRNLLSGYGYFEDWLPDYISTLHKELGDVAEGLHMPPLQATGQTIMTNEKQAPFGMSVLPPSERDELAEYINSYKTIKKEIARLLQKAGKDPKIMENFNIKNIKKAEDEKVPADRPAHYNEPTKTPKHNPSNLGGNRTGLVMTKAEMWEGEEGEHERIESMLNTKLHDAFHKVTGMIMKDLMADGFDGGDIKNFLQHEIDERAKEAINAQHDF